MPDLFDMVRRPCSGSATSFSQSAMSSASQVRQMSNAVHIAATGTQQIKLFDQAQSRIFVGYALTAKNST
jgi:hypothetical protein